MFVTSRRIQVGPEYKFLIDEKLKKNLFQVMSGNIEQMPWKSYSGIIISLKIVIEMGLS